MALQLETVNEKVPRALQWRGTPMQKAFLANWLEPTSETFSNAYQSAIKAGFKPKYAKDIVTKSPKWLLDFADRMDMQDVHIKAGIQQIATDPNVFKDSRSPADTRLKAYETLAKIQGMIDKQGGINIVNVQPILGGVSRNKPTKPTRKVVDVEQGEPDPDKYIPID